MAFDYRTYTRYELLKAGSQHYGPCIEAMPIILVQYYYLYLLKFYYKVRIKLILMFVVETKFINTTQH